MVHVNSLPIATLSAFCASRAIGQACLVSVVVLPEVDMMVAVGSDAGLTAGSWITTSASVPSLA